jgi:Holliday junction resolvase RusA-like endonuclease
MTVHFVADALAVSNSDGKVLSVDIHVDGEPRVQERPRHCHRGSKHWVYDPTKELKAEFREVVKAAFTDLGIHDFPLFGVPLKYIIVFGVSNPEKDVDNLLKFVMDALETVIYANDNKVRKVDMEANFAPLPDQFISIQAEPRFQV